jgi:hypothetical protein
MKLLSLFALISFSALAQDYTLYQAENDHYRDYTREQLMERMGEASALLPQYACNGKNELDPFWPAIRQNKLETSLQIKLYKSEVKIVYKNGEYFKLNGEVQTDLSNIFVAYVVEALKKIEEMPEGQKVLRQLERSHFPLVITYGGNAFNPRDDAGVSYRGIYRANALSIFNHGRFTNEVVPFNNIGAGGSIGWDPKTVGLLPHIALAHEMFHAFDSIRGILDMRFVHGEEYEQAFVSEYRAVYFENLTRKASGVAYRTHYGQEQTGPGVLDANGEPRKMPSPCLK